MRKIKVLIVDDSKVMRLFLQTLFNEAPDIEVIGFAEDGKQGVSMTKQLKPDLVTMDIMMPRMNGFEATKQIMDECPTPIIVLSSLIAEDELDSTFKALKLGALAAYGKPILVNESFEQRKRELLTHVRALSEIHVIRRPQIKQNMAIKGVGQQHSIKVLAFGASTGGTAVLASIVASLDADFPVPIVGVLHISKGFLKGFVDWLQKLTTLNICIAKQGESLLPGRLYFAPDGYHLTVKQRDRPMAMLNSDPPVGQFKPSVTKLFESLASEYPGHAMAGVFTGMGSDGADGLVAMKEVGCRTFGQSAATSVVSGMLQAAQEKNAIDDVVELEDIAAFFKMMVN